MFLKLFIGDLMRLFLYYSEAIMKILNHIFYGTKHRYLVPFFRVEMRRKGD